MRLFPFFFFLFLVDLLQDRLGVSPAALVLAASVVVGPGASGNVGAPAAEAKTEFDVVIEEVPSNTSVGVRFRSSTNECATRSSEELKPINLFD